MINWYFEIGFGHATRALQLALDLLSNSGKSQLYLISNAPQFIFQDGLNLFPSRLFYKHSNIDAGVVQPLAYTVDRNATVQQLSSFLSNHEEKWKEQESFLKSVKATCVLADAPFLPCKASELGIETIIVSNFTFDEIYLGLCGKDSLDSDIRNLSQIAIQYYSQASLLLRLPGSIRIPSFELGNEKVVSFTSQERRRTNGERWIVDTPLIFRKSRSPKEFTCENLGIPESVYKNSKILLLSFGGQSLVKEGWEGVLPEGWICITCGIGEVNVPGFYSAGRDSYVPDLVEASDVVMGKLGYGTVSECIGHSKPMLYVPRAQFIEEVGLRNLMENQGSCIELPIAHFESLQWKESILKASLLSYRKPTISMQGSPSIAKWILKYLDLQARR
eukprot:TRINITY_DN2511_c0_g1_i4.p1 TRINITY_DN2511_c0_g1~~TRINITY_DN2511_c0_g1_i4.p1  ORF type:complete len:390 (+),score=61.29 TRINITY_DN2511_c0_g1_i4:188-1357(+)